MNFLEKEVKDELNKPVPAYDDKTIAYLLKHKACCYFNWLAYYASQQPVEALETEEPKTVDLIGRHFTRVDNGTSAIEVHHLSRRQSWLFYFSSICKKYRFD